MMTVPRTPRTLLIVDDVPPVLAWARRAFTHAGWTVVTADDGASALVAWETAVAAGTPPQLLLTDLGMPGLDGFALTRHIRRLSPDVPIIVMSGLDFDEVSWNAVPHDRTLFLRKPMQRATLLAAADALVFGIATPGESEDIPV